MAIPREELGRRIRLAREAAGLTQADLAGELGIPRTAVGEIESGGRNVSGLELERIAHLSGRSLEDFLRAEFTEEQALRVLFRADPVEGVPAIPPQLRDCIRIARERQNLERHLGIERIGRIGTSYAVDPPKTRWEAITQGDRVAIEERRRLGLGSLPVPEIEHVIEAQGVQTAVVEFADDVSGAALLDGPYPLLVAVNGQQHANRKRFSFAHEYAHVLFDHDTYGRVTRTTESSDLREVRANAFAAAFLMPAEGVRDALAELGKGSPSRVSAAVFDGDDERVEPALVAESRAEPGSQDVQPFDVIELADRFEVSPTAMIYRLRNLRLISEPELERLRGMDEQRRLSELNALVQHRRAAGEEAVLRGASALPNRRFLGLALEVYRREKISRGKLLELLRLVGLNQVEVEQLISSALADDDAADSSNA